MKRSFALLAFVLTAALLSACAAVNVPPASPAVTNTSAESTPTSVATLTPVLTPEPTGEEETGDGYGDAEALNAALAECYSYEIEQADKCRIQVGDNKFYFDTTKPMLLDFATMDVEFPLYCDNKDNGTEFLGTIGYSFKVCGPYIYVESDVLWEDYPGREMTRIVNINDLSVTPFGRDVCICVPDAQGDKVYYNYEIDDCIYVADPSLKDAKKLHIEVPDKDTIEQEAGLSIEDVYVSINITDVSDGWIYFSYNVFDYEGPEYYYGHYRIKTDGSAIEKTDDGQFGDDIEFDD